MDGNITIKVAEDRSNVVLSLDGESAATATLTPHKLAELVDSLAYAMALLREGAPAPQLEGVNVRPVKAPWFLQGTPGGEASMMSFYHPGFGPVGFLLTKPDLLTVAETARRILETPPKPPESVDAGQGGL